MLSGYADKVGVGLTYFKENKTFSFSRFVFNILKWRKYKMSNVLIHRSSLTFRGQGNSQTKKLAKFYQPLVINSFYYRTDTRVGGWILCLQRQIVMLV